MGEINPFAAAALASRSLRSLSMAATAPPLDAVRDRLSVSPTSCTDNCDPFFLQIHPSVYSPNATIPTSSMAHSLHFASQPEGPPLIFAPPVKVVSGVAHPASSKKNRSHNILFIFIPPYEFSVVIYIVCEDKGSESFRNEERRNQGGNNTYESIV